MRNLLKVAVPILLLVIGSTAWAQGGGQSKAQSVSTGRFEGYMSAFYMALSAGSTTYSVGPGFNLIFFPKIPWLQVGGEMTYQKISSAAASTTNFLFLGGLTGNVGGATLNDSYFASLGIALKGGSGDVEETDPNATNPNGFGFYFIAGKRFPIGGGWAMRPSMGVAVAGSSALLIRPFAFSYHF